MRLNSGPPRLRIDNVINGRVGTSADECVIDDDNETDDKCDGPMPRPEREEFTIRGSDTLQLGSSSRELQREEMIEGKRRVVTPDEIWSENSVKRDP
jgi:hypothetical protein